MDPGTSLQYLLSSHHTSCCKGIVVGSDGACGSVAPASARLDLAAPRLHPRIHSCLPSLRRARGTVFFTSFKNLNNCACEFANVALELNCAGKLESESHFASMF